MPEAFQALSKHLSAYIIGEGQKLITDEKMKPDEFVAQVIALREKMMNIHTRSFGKDSNIELTIKTAFENFIN